MRVDTPQARTAVVEALSGMPRAQREAMVLRFLGGVSRRHIAAVLRLPLERVDWLLDDGQAEVARRLRTCPW